MNIIMHAMMSVCKFLKELPSFFSLLREETDYIPPETHKELKRITRVHSVRIFSLPSTIFGNTKRLYANDLLT